LLTPWGKLKGVHQAGQLVDCIMPDYFDSIIPRVTSATTGVVTIPQAVRKMNGDRPTISALQKAGRLAERRMTLPTPQDDEDHEAFAAELEKQLQAVGPNGCNCIGFCG
jgi:hypothetical protein